MYDMDDFLDSLENRAENWYFDNVNNGIATCSCGEVFEFDKGYQISANPYSIPVCGKCYDKCFEEMARQSKDENLPYSGLDI